MAEGIRVRPAEAEDDRHIAAFQQAMAEETEGRPLDAEVLERGVRAVFDDPGKALYWIAEADGEVAGSLMVTPEWSDWRNGTFWWIQSVYVRPEFRRRGVYRALHARIRADAKATEGVCGVRLYVDADNKVARAVYEALGMARTEYLLYEEDFVL